MNLLSVLYNIIIAPIEMIIEMTFSFEYTKLGILGVGGAIIAVSLVMNFLALPLYNIADAIQEKERDIQKTLSSGIKRIKETFVGDERFMILSTYYKENNYSPLYALRSSLSILLEIPFFIAAYHYLSHCQILAGTSFAFLKDMGAPDNLLKMSWGGVQLSLNLLPIIMTLINIASAAVYLKGFPLREKIQTYALAAIFLILLYNSPSGLVFYWILNNLFSLAKNVVTKYFSHPGVVVHNTLSVIFLLLAGYLIIQKDFSTIKKLSFLIFTLTIIIVPLIIKRLNKSQILKNFLNIHRIHKNKKNKRIKKVDLDKKGLFFSTSLGLTLLCGWTLITSIVMSNPSEFSFIGEVSSPIYYVIHALTIFFGLFSFWPCVVYKMFSTRTKNILTWIMTFFFLSSILCAFVFSYDYGTFNTFFRLDDKSRLKNYSFYFTVIPILAIIIIFILIFVIRKFEWEKHLSILIYAFCAALFIYGGIKILSINKTFQADKITHLERIKSESETIKPIYHLSKTKKNVIFIFVDRYVSSYVPYIIKEFPELQKTFSGFVYYPNTVSFGMFTTFAAPAMLGGYEYSPENENKRPKVSIKDKIVESALVMPKIFSDAGFDISISESTFLNKENTKNIPGVRLLKPKTLCYENYKADFSDEMKLESQKFIMGIKKHSVGFILMEIALPILRNFLYNYSNYFQTVPPTLDYFLEEYAHLFYLDKLTDCTQDNDTWTFISNELPHQAAFLKPPYYTPSGDAYLGKKRTGFFESDDDEEIKSYHVNAATILQLGRFIKKLKDLGVYDRTRIVIASDHGDNISAPPIPKTKGDYIARCNPLLMEKDFFATGDMETNNRFMTNADAIFLLKKNIKISDTNPYTQNKFSDYCDKSQVHIFSHTENAKLKDLNGNIETTWDLSTGGYSVHDNIFNPSNWKSLDNDR